MLFIILTVAWVTLFVAATAIHFTAMLTHNKALYFLSGILFLASTGLQLANGLVISAILINVFYLVGVLCFALHFVWGKDAAYWVGIGAFVAMQLSAIDIGFLPELEPLKYIVAFGLPFIAWIAVSVPTAILVPRKWRKERTTVVPHITSSTLIGMSFPIAQEATEEQTARINVADIDWAVVPEDGKSAYAVGTEVTVVGISGVRLIVKESAASLKAKKEQAKQDKAKSKKEKAKNKKEQRTSEELLFASRAEEIRGDIEVRLAEIEANKEIEKARIEAEKELKLKELELQKATEEVKEETVVEETVVEEPAPVVEETVVQEETVVEETVVEEPVVEETVVEEPAPVVEEQPVEEETTSTKIIRIPFVNRFLEMDEDTKANYNALKSETLAYGVKSRFSSSGDSFRLHRKTYVKISVAGKGLKVYLALDPNDYADSPIPVKDVGHKNVYKDIPVAFRVKSPLSLKRCKKLIEDAMAKDGLVKGEVVEHDWAADIIEAVNNNTVDVEQDNIDESNED